MSGFEVVAIVAGLLGVLAGVPLGRWLRRVTYRKPDEESMALPGSRWWVAPVLGAIFAALTWRFLAAPAATKVGFDPGSADGTIGAGQILALLTFAAIAVACVCLAAMDLDVHRLPDRIMWPTMGALIVGLFVAAASEGLWGIFGRVLVTGLVCGIGYLVISLVSLARGSLALGLGDVKLATVLGAGLGWFGWQSVMVGMYSGFLVGGLVAAMLLVTGKIRLGGELAFGPPMMVGALIGALLPPNLISLIF